MCEGGCNPPTAAPGRRKHVSQLAALMLEAAQALREGALEELWFMLLAGLMLAAVLYAHRRIRQAFRERIEANLQWSFLVDLLFPALYYAMLRVLHLPFAAPVGQSFTVAAMFLYLSIGVVRNSDAAIGPCRFVHPAVVYALIGLAAAALAASLLASALGGPEEPARTLTLAFKLAAATGGFILYMGAIRALMRALPVRLVRTRRILGSLNVLYAALYLAATAIWFGSDVTLPPRALPGAVLVLALIAAYRAATHVLSRRLDQAGGPSGDTAALGRSARRSVALVAGLGLYKVFELFFGLDAVVTTLKGTYVVKTDIIEMSFHSLISATYVLFLLLALVGAAGHALHLYYTRRGRTVEAGSVRAIVYNAGILVTAIVFLSMLGVTWKALIPVAGALGIGVGFGLQGIMNNYLSGFILLFTRKLKVGDVIELEGNAGREIKNTLPTIYGKVVSIDALSTVVKTSDGIEIVIPNSHFLSEKIVNYSLTDNYIRVRVPFGVSYGSDPNTIRDVLLEVAHEHPQVLKNPPPDVWFAEMASSSLVFYLLLWVNIRMLWRINPFVSDIYYRGWYALKEAGVEIPFPQRDLWFKNRLQVEVAPPEGTPEQAGAERTQRHAPGTSGGGTEG